MGLEISFYLVSHFVVSSVEVGGSFVAYLFLMHSKRKESCMVWLNCQSYLSLSEFYVKKIASFCFQPHIICSYLSQSHWQHLCPPLHAKLLCDWSESRACLFMRKTPPCVSFIALINAKLWSNPCSQASPNMVSAVQTVFEHLVSGKKDKRNT